MLDEITLFVRSPADLARFYCRTFRMKILSVNNNDGSCVVGFPPEGLNGSRRDATLCLKRCAKPKAQDSDHNAAAASAAATAASTCRAAPLSRTERYWKIGITVPNVDEAVAEVRATGATCTDGAQFKDIGYVAHLKDPEGFAIELLQFEFGRQVSKQDSPDSSTAVTDAAGTIQNSAFASARIGQVTLRAKDKAEVLDCWVQRVGLQLLSIQPVEEFDFELYFFAGLNLFSLTLFVLIHRRALTRPAMLRGLHGNRRHTGENRC